MQSSSVLAFLFCIFSVSNFLSLSSFMLLWMGLGFMVLFSLNPLCLCVFVMAMKPWTCSLPFGVLCCDVIQSLSSFLHTFFSVFHPWLLSQICSDFDQIYGFSFGVLAFKSLLLSFSPVFASLCDSPLFCSLSFCLSLPVASGHPTELQELDFV